MHLGSLIEIYRDATGSVELDVGTVTPLRRAPAPHPVVRSYLQDSATATAPTGFALPVASRVEFHLPSQG